MKRPECGHLEKERASTVKVGEADVCSVGDGEGHGVCGRVRVLVKYIFRVFQENVPNDAADPLRAIHAFSPPLSLGKAEGTAILFPLLEFSALDMLFPIS